VKWSAQFGNLILFNFMDEVKQKIEDLKRRLSEMRDRL
jgi:hypothetical protein